MKNQFLFKIEKKIKSLKRKITRLEEKKKYWESIQFKDNQTATKGIKKASAKMAPASQKLEQLEVQKLFLRAIIDAVRATVVRESNASNAKSSEQYAIDMIGEGELEQALGAFQDALLNAGLDLNSIYRNFLNIADLARRTDGTLNIAEYLFYLADINLTNISRFKTMWAMVYILQAEAEDGLVSAPLKRHIQLLFEAIKIAEFAEKFEGEETAFRAKHFAGHRYLGTLGFHLDHLTDEQINIGREIGHELLKKLNPESLEGIRIRYSLAMIQGFKDKLYLNAARELEHCMEKAFEYNWPMDAAPYALHSAELYFEAYLQEKEKKYKQKARTLLNTAQKYMEKMDKFSTDKFILKRMDALNKKLEK